MPTKQIQIPIQLGEPVEHRGVVVAPLFPRSRPRAEYLTLEEALPLGFRVSEVDAAGSVPELLVSNPLESDVLLYDGEELLGAKQNRILNVTVLVAALSETRIPVSCVEAGRWHARSAFFDAARHAAYLLHRNDVVGSGLELEGELLQLCAFSTEQPHARTRIARPSERS